MGMMDRFSKAPTPPKTSTSTLALTSNSNEETKITKARKDIVDELLKDNKLGAETLAWIINSIQISPTNYGAKAFISSVGKIQYNANHTARLLAAQRKDSLMDAIMEALPGINFGGPTTGGTDKKEMEDALAGLVAALDKVIELACPGYSESAPHT